MNIDDGSRQSQISNQERLRKEQGKTPQEEFNIRPIIDDLRNYFFSNIPSHLKDTLNYNTFNAFTAKEAVNQIDEQVRFSFEKFGKKLLRDDSNLTQMISGEVEVGSYLPLEALAYFGIGYRTSWYAARENMDEFGVEKIGGTYRYPGCAIMFIKSIGGLHGAIQPWLEQEVEWRRNLEKMKAEHEAFPLYFTHHSSQDFSSTWTRFLQANEIPANDDKVSFDALMQEYLAKKSKDLGIPSDAQPRYGVRSWRIFPLENNSPTRITTDMTRVDPSQTLPKNEVMPDSPEKSFQPVLNAVGIFENNQAERWATLSAMSRLVQVDYNRVRALVKKYALPSVRIDERNVVFSVKSFLELPEIQHILNLTIDEPMSQEVMINGRVYVTHLYLLDAFQTTKVTLERLARDAGAKQSVLSLSYKDAVTGERKYTVGYDVELMRSNPAFRRFEKAAANCTQPITDPDWKGFYLIEGKKVGLLPEIIRKLSGTTDEKALDAWEKQFAKRLKDRNFEAYKQPILSRASGAQIGYDYEEVREIMEGYSYIPRKKSMQH